MTTYKLCKKTNFDTSIYVSPTGTGDGLDINDPANLFDVLDNRISSVSNKATIIYCLPGTYDFGTRSYTYLSSSQHLNILAYDTNNPPVFTRASGSGVQSNPFFYLNNEAILTFSDIIFDKWVDGTFNNTTDIPYIVIATGRSGINLYGNIEIRASKSNASFSPFTLTNGKPGLYVACYPGFTFNSLTSVSGDSSVNNYIFKNTSEGDIIFDTTINLQMHGLGDWISLVSGRCITPSAGNSIAIKFDKIYRLFDGTHCLGNLYINLTNQGYNNDGTVNTSAVGGTDYYCKDRLFYFHRSRIVVKITLNSNIYLNGDDVKYISLYYCSSEIMLYPNSYKLHCSTNNCNRVYDIRYGDTIIDGSMDYPTSGVVIDTGIIVGCMYYCASNYGTIYLTVIDGTTTGIIIERSSKITVWSTSISNCTTGIDVSNNSHLYLYNATFSGNTTNTQVETGSSIVT